ncbi:adenylyltransferase and sulfurtransferase MOCS3-like [Aricia agestis]|uniref:adenylyltransferase and sulfurtransferase MOCS3-like n=1 Tax=Aricia agestis TaxID=91739 RepID=UPI001C202A3A|nr:adenylyltransferase and sulfurtransferase MOCS3-like [Aricia agestis]
MEEVEQLEADIAELRKLLQCKEGELFDMKQKLLSGPPIHGENGYNTQTLQTNYTPRTQMSNVPKWAIERYSRQILLPDIGIQGQEKLMGSKVLVVGAGGLGCPAAVYLAGAGVGEIGIVDYDCVDITNIHRQILHEEKDENTCKADSAADSLRRLNTKIKVTPYNLQLDSKNALQIISHYDLVLDCTDNVPTRFLLNDACVMTKKPLISGSALKMEGQLTLYGYRSENNYNEKDTTFVGPCYRCVFPSPPPPEAVGSCSANGVAGPVPGIIGAMQALEAIKLIVGQTHDSLLVGRMLLFDGEDMTFRNVKLRPRNPECAVCSPNPTITSLIDYEVFCKAQAKEKDLDLQVLTPEYRKSATQLADEMTQTNVTEERHLLVDVRSAPEFNMCNIEGAVNYPIEKLYDATLNKLVEDIKESNQVTFICRRGNDSQLAVQKVLELVEEPYRSRIKDLTGGLHAWFCPSVFIYLALTVPAIWLLELHKVDLRLQKKSNLTVNMETEIPIPVATKLETDTWVTLIEQFLMLTLIVGRWLLPKGDLTRDQLSQLLLVYIGTAADIIEFFDSFKDDKVATETVLVMLTLAIWSWSLMQFTVVLTATKSRKSRGTAHRSDMNTSRACCCSIEVCAIMMNIVLQDAPFLAFRLLIIAHYKIINYMNIFFTCKNTLVILLQIYRLYVLHLETVEDGNGNSVYRKRRKHESDEKKDKDKKHREHKAKKHRKKTEETSISVISDPKRESRVDGGRIRAIILTNSDEIKELELSKLFKDQVKIENEKKSKSKKKQKSESSESLNNIQHTTDDSGI